MSEKHLESLDLNLLLPLHWLLTERNVTAAADRVGLSQPATSRALARLREVFSDPLLVKSGNGMAPTPMAEKLQPVVAHAVERCRDVLRITDNFDVTSQRGSFRIACKDYVGAMVASAWAKVIAPAAPGLDLDIINLSLEVSRDLVSGKIDMVIVPDIALMNLPPSLDIDQFVRRKILNQNYLCAVRKDHPIGNGKLTLKRFTQLQHVLVTPEGSKVGIVDRILAEQGLERRIAYRTDAFLLALPIIHYTDCIITAPEALLNLDKNNLKILPSCIDVPGYSLNGAWHPNWTHDERHKWVRDKLFKAMPEVTGCNQAVT